MQIIKSDDKPTVIQIEVVDLVVWAGLVALVVVLWFAKDSGPIWS